MRRVRYGTKTIEYSIEEKVALKAHYITVERHSGVVLKGKPVPAETADQLVLKKAGWILKKLEEVGAATEEDIVTGARITYLGKSYYTEVVINPAVAGVVITFNHSRFKVYVEHPAISQEQIRTALHEFYKEKAVEKIEPRVKKLAAKVGLSYKSLSFRKMAKRWGSCTADNKIILNIDAVKLPFTLIDYLILHELCHTKVKDHSKAFWAELSLHIPNWRTLDEQVAKLKL